MATRKGYARRHLGGGNALKAVTRARRRSPAGVIGKAPGKEPGPANWRAARRKAMQALTQVVEELEDDLVTTEGSGGSHDTVEAEYERAGTP